MIAWVVLPLLSRNLVDQWRRPFSLKNLKDRVPFSLQRRQLVEPVLILRCVLNKVAHWLTVPVKAALFLGRVEAVSFILLASPADHSLPHLSVGRLLDRLLDC
jgi:hypothetical protein